jgi:hypothetical protein
LDKEKYSCAKSIPDTRDHIDANINFHVYLNGGSNRFMGYEFFMIVNEKEID